MKHFYLLLALSSFLVSALPATAQISIDEVNAEQEGVTFRDRLKSTPVDVDYFSLARYKAERAAIRKERNYLEISASVQGTLTSFNDPWIEVSGGDNSIAAIGTFFLDHIFTKDKFSIETKASAKFGYNRIKAVPEGEEGEVGIWYKNQDEFWVQTAPSFNFSKNWSYGAMLKFRTQFANGYKARTQQKEIHRKSTFMSPGYLDLSVGLTYNCPNKSFPVKINMSPVALSAVFVESKQIRENFVYDFSEANKEAGTRKYVEPYGVPSNKTSKYEGGSSIQIDFDRTFGKTGFLRYRTTLYSFYGWITDIGQKNKISDYTKYLEAYDKWADKEDSSVGHDIKDKPRLPIHPTVRWENTLEIKATKYLSTKVSFQLYYNRAQNVDVQTRTLLQVGLTYTFKNKPKP